MKKSIVAVFAHPDDEAFGPAGTLAALAKTHDVYLLCATRGEAGQNSHKDKETKLSDLREKELLKSAKILGIKEVHFLDFIDGTLSNNLYHKLAGKITEYLEKIKPYKILTYEYRGISGHLDHIAVSLATTFAAKKLPFIKEIMYYALVKEQRNPEEDYFIFFPPAYKKERIDLVVETEDVWDTKIKAMLSHESQKHDSDRIIKRQKNMPKREYFHILKLHEG